ncbi:MAG: ATPase, T2SS/T4P/T4SS family [Candidatus Omnitrophota bacterium]|nr:ATPase, T2SS/T4P/T4SS family [Candidatus Omnitrophota bacterium]
MAATRLGELLVTKKIISEEQLEEVLAEQQKSGEFIGQILVRKGYANEKEVAQSLGEQLGFAYVDLENYNLEPEITKILPEELAKKHLALPLFKSASTVTMAMVNPLDVKAVDELSKIMKLRIKPVFATPALIKECMEKEYHKKDSLIVPKDTAAEMEDLRDADFVKIASLAPVISIVDNLIARAVEQSASDIHLEPEGRYFYCRYRIDGVLHDMPQLPKRYEAGIISRIKIMANMDIAERRLPQDGRLETAVGNKNIDLRISTFPTMHGENVVLRILDKSRSLIKLEELGMVSDTLKLFKEVVHKPHGINLVTGPTGSGKTTTLYAVLTEINSIEKNIVTMEDPIEYEIERVRQSQVNVKAGITFAAGLRSIVRQDPDIIMIGEIRDHETAEIAIHAALTGHLVFSTLHTNDAASAVTRLIDMGIEPFLVSSSLICVVAQRLVRILCPHCKEGYDPSDVIARSGNTSSVIASEAKQSQGLLRHGVYTERSECVPRNDDTPMKFYREKGCDKCRNTGYSGRIGIFEMFMPNEQIRALIDKKAQASQIKEAAIRQGMETLREDGVNKLIQGITSLSELLRVTQQD